jgi:hypothetical protein
MVGDEDAFFSFPIDIPLLFYFPSFLRVIVGKMRL